LRPARSPRLIIRMVKSDIPTVVNDIAFIGFIVLFTLYVWLFCSTVASMRSPTARQKRLKKNRLILRLRSPESTSSPKLPKTINAAAGKEGEKTVIRQIIEAMAHPLAFLASFSNVCLTLSIAYIAYTLEAQPYALILVAVLPIGLGSVSSTGFLLGMSIFWWDTVNVESSILRNIVIISSGSFGAAAFLVRCRELFIPLCTPQSSLAPKAMTQAPRESSYGRAWSPFRSSSSAASSSAPGEPMDPRCSSISDITLDEALRTPSQSLYPMSANLVGAQPTASSDYVEYDVLPGLLSHGGARLCYADLVNNLVTVTCMIWILEDPVSATWWTASNWLSAGGGGIFWVIARIFLGPNDFYDAASG